MTAQHLAPEKIWQCNKTNEGSSRGSGRFKHRNIFLSYGVELINASIHDGSLSLLALYLPFIKVNSSSYDSFLRWNAQSNIAHSQPIIGTLVDGSAGSSGRKIFRNPQTNNIQYDPTNGMHLTFLFYLEFKWKIIEYVFVGNAFGIYLPTYAFNPLSREGHKYIEWNAIKLPYPFFKFTSRVNEKLSITTAIENHYSIQKFLLLTTNTYS